MHLSSYFFYSLFSSQRRAQRILFRHLFGFGAYYFTTEDINLIFLHFLHPKIGQSRPLLQLVWSCGQEIIHRQSSTLKNQRWQFWRKWLLLLKSLLRGVRSLKKLAQAACQTFGLNFWRDIWAIWGIRARCGWNFQNI